MNWSMGLLDTPLEPAEEEAEGVAVTGETARRIAETYLAQHPDLGATGVGEVRRWNERPGGFPGIYWAGWSRPAPDELARAWVAYLARPGDGTMLRSSLILVISHGTGEVLYAGSANDEG